jgi:hypothetical protein
MHHKTATTHIEKIHYLYNESGNQFTNAELNLIFC